MNQEEEKKLRELARSGFGKILLDYIEEKIAALKDIRTVQNWEEGLGRKQAIEKLEEIFRFLKSQRGNPSKQNKNEYL